MTPAQVGLIWGEHQAHTRHDQIGLAQVLTGTAPALSAPQPTHQEEMGTTADLAYWASLPLRG
jgi:hypothetical protein